jgi:hypothetical protein
MVTKRFLKNVIVGIVAVFMTLTFVQRLQSNQWYRLEPFLLVLSQKVL